MSTGSTVGGGLVLLVLYYAAMAGAFAVAFTVVGAIVVVILAVASVFGFFKSLGEAQRTANRIWFRDLLGGPAVGIGTVLLMNVILPGGRDTRVLFSGLVDGPNASNPLTINRPMWLTVVGFATWALIAGGAFVGPFMGVILLQERHHSDRRWLYPVWVITGFGVGVIWSA